MVPLLFSIQLSVLQVPWSENATQMTQGFSAAMHLIVKGMFHDSFQCAVGQANSSELSSRLKLR